MDEPIEPDAYRIAGRLGELVRRVPRLAWPFLILAAYDLGLFLADGISSWTLLTLFLVAASVGWALLPAAVILGRPTAWQSERGILVGAIAWSAVGPVGHLIWRVPILLGLDSSDGAGSAAISLLAVAGRVAGPAIIAIVLERRRRTSTTWPAPLLAIVAVLVAATCVQSTSSTLDWYNAQLNFGFGAQDMLAGQIRVVAAAVAPLSLLTVGALAWSALSAVRAGEEPRRFWVWITAGSAALLATNVLGYAMMFFALAVGSPAYILDLFSAYNDIVPVSSVIGIGLLLLAFVIGAPNDPLDLGEVVADLQVPLGPKPADASVPA